MTRQQPARNSAWSATLPRAVALRRAAIVTLLATTTLNVSGAMAASGATETTDSPASPWHINGEIELQYEAERNFDLDSRENENEAVLEPELDLEIGYRPTPLFQGFARLELTREYGVGGEAENESARLKLAELYVSSQEIEMPGGGEISLYVGRRLFADERQWLYDEQLDGVTMIYDYNAWSFLLSATRQQEKDLLSNRQEDEADYYIARSRYQLDQRTLGAYLIKRHERDDNGARPLFVGIQSFGELWGSTDYWLELAHVRGDDGDSEIRGWGLDAGAIYHFDAPLSPSLIAGYAFGSGDANPGGVDRAFRQTGLQDNEQDLGGLVNFDYLGLVLDPGLSNLRVWTAGVGLQPHDHISAQLLWHRYRQDHASENLRDTNLDAAPNGTDPDLGYAIDLVLGAEVSKSIELEGVVGYFRPGGAFAESKDNALFLGLKIEYEF
ncbi:MAG TPA: alginate export family protein [Salinisphaeraceae bacterium]|nr:alginate export family protein [Salinisphaeraceae bacterium]